MRGQKSRSGPGVRKGFEGGQMPLYSRVPNLRGIAGETLEEKGLINPSGKERALPLKVLSDGELSAKLNIKARSAAAVAKNLTRAEEYFAEKRAAAAASEPTAA
ncbi:hypothetical protein DKX38_015735 [Salix brachista]|uniref:Large ribosomal subunit protein uL15/eL18 domain-containing protein n=1 Tax=Salix brachista TaxID=2182728 RepID=A0A5N5L681_9ROSI|nr:hypothetical protein DKX38_015735 [Salix brachista]